jgi:hypothetical protein
MAVTDADIEESITIYMKESLARGDTPTRAGAIRHVTGEYRTLPSSVAKVIKTMMDSGAIQHINNDALRFTPKPGS